MNDKKDWSARFASFREVELIFVLARRRGYVPAIIEIVESRDKDDYCFITPTSSLKRGKYFFYKPESRNGEVGKKHAMVIIVLSQASLITLKSIGAR